MSSSDFEFDQLKMFCGVPYSVKSVNEGSHITITTPTIWDVVENGEREFYNALFVFVGNTTMYRLQLWKAGKDWNKVSDYELFCWLCRTVSKDFSKLLFQENIDFSSFEIYEKRIPDDEEKTTMTLYDSENDLEFSEETYLEVREYLRAMFNIYPKEQFARNKATKLAIIEDEETSLRISKMLGEDKPTSTLLPKISFVLNHPGFKYNLEELKTMNICQFMDSVQRLQSYENIRAIYSGVYSGFADFSKQIKADPDFLNFAKDLSFKEKKDLNEDNKTETGK